jgi:hypothetical protein
MKNREFRPRCRLIRVHIVNKCDRENCLTNSTQPARFDVCLRVRHLGAYPGNVVFSELLILLNTCHVCPLLLSHFPKGAIILCSDLAQLMHEMRFMTGVYLD